MRVQTPAAWMRVQTPAAWMRVQTPAAWMRGQIGQQQIWLGTPATSRLP